MEIGDLIVDKEYPSEPGIIVGKSADGYYRVLNDVGQVVWFTGEYIENGCEVLSEKKP